MRESTAKEREIAKIGKELLDCQECPFYELRVRNGAKPVLGEGSLEARIMFVGEAPGYHESVQGRPFVGQAGQVLDELLASVGLKREDVYITNLVNDRPSNNRDPTPQEIAAYAPFLEKLIKIIKPEIICTLGRFSMAYVLEKYGLKDKLQSISKIHGQVFEVQNLFTSVKIVTLYHPAVAVYSPNMKKVLLNDFRILKNV